MTNRLELNWKLDGFVDEQRYYCSETPFTAETKPSPKAILAGDVRTYTDTSIEAGKTYYVAVGSVKNGVEKLSEVRSVHAGDEHWDKVTALLHFDGDLIDASGKGTYTKTSGVTFSSTGALSGQAIKFDATYDYVSTNDPSAWQFGGGDFTLEFFVYLNDSSTAFQAIISKWSSSNGDCEFIFYRDSGSFRFDVRANNRSAYVVLLSAAQPTASQRTHVAISRQDNVFRMFYDGVKQHEQTSSVIINAAASALRIGELGTSGVPSVNGCIDEIRITKGVARYTENFTPPDAPFPSY